MFENYKIKITWKSYILFTNKLINSVNNLKIYYFILELLIINYYLCLTCI